MVGQVPLRLDALNPTHRATPRRSPGIRVPRWTWGDRVRKVRRDLNLNQDEFAQLLSVTQKTIASWETGSRTPRDSVALAQVIEDQTVLRPCCRCCFRAHKRQQ